MDKQEKYALGYEVDQLAKESPIMKFIGEKVEEGTLDDGDAADFYAVEWDRCVRIVAKKWGIADDTVVWDSFHDYNDA